MKPIFATATLLFLIICPGLHAQSGGVPQNSLLPEINPQDIEIRSEFKARFPGLRRQPILGFSPQPRVFRIDPDRLPFMETPEEAVAAISTTELDRPLPPRLEIFEIPPRMRALIRAGIGSYQSPEVEAYALHQLNRDGFISADLNLRSSAGHLRNQLSGFRFFDVNGLYSTKTSGNTRISIRGGAFSDFNHIFNLPLPVPDDGSGTAQKDYLGANLGLILNGNRNALEGWNVYLNMTASEIDLTSPVAGLAGTISEQNVHAGFEKNWAGARLNEILVLKINAAGGNLNNHTTGSSQWINTGASFGYSTILNYNTEINISGGFGFVSDAVHNTIVLVSDSKFKHSLTNRFALKGSLYAMPVMRTALEHNQINRFLNNDLQLQYEYVLGAIGGVEFIPVKETKLYGNFRFENINNKAYYIRDERDYLTGGIIPPAVVSIATYYGVHYRDATLLELKTGITQQIVSDFLWFDGSVYARSYKFKNGKYIPFEERLGAEAAVNFKPVSRIKINSWIQYIGERENSLNLVDLKGYILLNAGAEADITRRIGVYIKLLNMLSSNYAVWDGYTERPFQFFGGIKLKL